MCWNSNIRMTFFYTADPKSKKNQEKAYFVSVSKHTSKTLRKFGIGGVHTKCKQENVLWFILSNCTDPQTIQPWDISNFPMKLIWPTKLNMFLITTKYSSVTGLKNTFWKIWRSLRGSTTHSQLRHPLNSPLQKQKILLIHRVTRL